MIQDRAGIWHNLPHELAVRPPLMPHQIAGAAWLSRAGNWLHAGEAGVGKTAQIIEVINGMHDSARILILCPSSLRANWLKELALWLTASRRCEIGRRRIPESKVVILQYDALARLEVQLRATRWDLVVMDEAHALKNSESIKARQILGDAWTRPLPAEKFIIATATPILNRPAELWPLLAILGVPISRATFEARFCSTENLNECRDPDGLRQLLAPIMLRQTKAECLNLPPKTRKVITIEPDGEWGKAEIAQSAWENECQKVGEFTGSMARGKLADLRQRTTLAKLAMPAVKQHLWMAASDESKLVVVCHHIVAMKAAADIFPAGSVVTFSGDESPKQRNAAVERFQSDPACRVIVITIGSGGVGITLTAACRMIFIERLWTPALVDQAEDRIHRIGQIRPVLIEHIVIRGSIEARQIEIELEKQRNIEKVIAA